MVTLIDAKGYSYNCEIKGFRTGDILILSFDGEEEFININEVDIIIKE